MTFANIPDFDKKVPVNFLLFGLLLLANPKLQFTLKNMLLNNRMKRASSNIDFKVKSMFFLLRFYFWITSWCSISVVITCGSKLLNADWLRQREFYLNHEGTVFWWKSKRIFPTKNVLIRRTGSTQSC